MSASGRTETREIYHENPRLRELEVEILMVQQLNHDNRPCSAVLLDRTIMYPEGGGQPGDRGFLDSHRVLGTIRRKDLSADQSIESGNPDSILHLTALNTRLEPGMRVTQSLDWKHRWEYMQQHSGQHVLSAAFWQIGRYPTISVHQGESHTTIEFEAGDIPDADIDRAARLANEAVMADLPIRSRIISKDEAGKLSLRRELKVRSGAIRILEIGRQVEDQTEKGGASRFPENGLFDRVGCGGVHLERTGEIRLIQHMGTERIRGRVRLYWMIGDRALADYGEKTRVCSRVGTLLSRPLDGISSRTEEVLEEGRVLRRRIRELERRTLMRELAEADSSPDGSLRRIFLESGDPELLKEALKLVQKQYPEPTVICAWSPESGDRLLWGIHHGGPGSLDFQALRQGFLARLGAQGGGRQPIWQGSLQLSAGSDPEARARDFLAGLGQAVTASTLPD